MYLQGNLHTVRSEFVHTVSVFHKIFEVNAYCFSEEKRPIGGCEGDNVFFAI
jgi:hypothetical protein